MDNKSLGYNWANPLNYDLLKYFARQLKANPTLAEQALWPCLANKQLGFRFRRQYIIDDYIVDFVCLPQRLVVEIDGAYHDEEEQQKVDALRSERLNALGFRVIRFSNEEVLNNIEEVLSTIKANILKSK